MIFRSTNKPSKLLFSVPGSLKQLLIEFRKKIIIRGTNIDKTPYGKGGERKLELVSRQELRSIRQ